MSDLSNYLQACAVMGTRNDPELIRIALEEHARAEKLEGELNDVRNLLREKILYWSRKLILPKFTPESLEDFSDTCLVEFIDGIANWSQTAVDFAILLNNARPEWSQDQIKQIEQDADMMMAKMRPLPQVEK